MSGRELRLGLTVLFAALFGICLGAGALGFAWATWPKPEAEISFATPQIVEVPYEVEVVRTVEVVVTPTPALPLKGEGEATPEPSQNTEVAHTSPTPAGALRQSTPVSAPYDSPLQGGEVCTDEARIEMQPVSDIQAGALEVGKLRRLTWLIENTGDCYWDGYTFESQEDPLVLQVPYTEPGGTAMVVYEFIVRDPLSLRMFLIPPQRTGLLGLSNANSIDAGAIYRLETYKKGAASSGGGLICGPGG